MPESRQETAPRGQARASHVEGFTLIEIMLVLAILAILGMVTLGYFRSINRDAEFQQCQANILLISQAMENYKAQAMFYPETLQQILYEEYGLPELPRCPGGGNHPAGGDYSLAIPSGEGLTFTPEQGYHYLIYCNDDRHKGKAPAGFPQYKSTTNKSYTGTND